MDCGWGKQVVVCALRTRVVQSNGRVFLNTIREKNYLLEQEAQGPTDLVSRAAQAQPRVLGLYPLPSSRSFITDSVSL